MRLRDLIMRPGADPGRTGVLSLVWVAAIVLTGLAASAARDMAGASSAPSSSVGLLAPPPVAVAKGPVPRAELLRVTEILKSGRPGVRVVLEGSPDAPVLSIAADRLEAWEAWEAAVAAALSTIPGGEWSFLQLCSGRECPHVPLSASLSVVRRTPN